MRLAALILFLAAPLSAQARQAPLFAGRAVDSPRDVIGSTAPLPAGIAPEPWLGEELTYDVKWGVLSLGEATLGVPNVVSFNGNPAYHILSTARTSKFADKFYKVRDVNESWLDPKGMMSLGYSKKLREGDFFRDEWVLFDYPEKTWISKKINKDDSFQYSTGTLPGPVQDILSSIYMIRPKPLNVGDEIVLDVNTKKNWPLVIKVLRKQTIRVPAGRFKCVLVEPFLRDEGLFIQKGRKLEIWLTDDEKHMPVMMRVDIILGKISAYLMKMGK